MTEEDKRIIRESFNAVDVAVRLIQRELDELEGMVGYGDLRSSEDGLASFTEAFAEVTREFERGT